MEIEALVGRNLTKKTYQFFNRWEVRHGIFWFLFLLVLIAVEGIEQGFWFSLSNELINVFFYGTIVYFNLGYLVPNYLTKKRFLTYAGLLILTSLIITPLKVIVFYFKFSQYPNLQADLVANQNMFFVFHFLVGGVSTIVKIIADWVKYVRERQELETRTMQSELRFLKSQINPHFLFNTLNNLYALTLKKDDKAPEIVIKLSEMMRYMLYECNEKRVLLSKEINYIRNYIDLEMLRQGKNVEISFEVDGEVSDQKVAPLMFIPFLENSFKHGLSHQLTTGFVNMKMHVQDRTVDFYIENSKPETPPQQMHHRPSGGIGLVNVQRRLNLLYPDHYDLKIKDSPKTYAVNLKIELD